MSEEQIFLEVKKFFCEQYDTVKRIVENRKREDANEFATEKIKNNAIQWCMSVLFFAHQIGGNYFNLESLCTEYKKKIENL